MTDYLRNIQVDTVGEAAEEIRDLLVVESWTVEAGSPSSLPMVLAGKEVNSVKPHLRFTNPSSTILRMNGDIDGAGTTLSTNREWTLSAGSRLWMAADDEACCIYIKPTSANGQAYHAGALEREVPTDGWAWAVGILSTTDSATAFQIAQKLNSTTKWENSDLYGGLYRNIFVQGTFSGSGFINKLTGLPILSPYFRYKFEEFRGVVKFATTGLAGAVAGTEYEQRDPITDDVTKIYVCSGVGGFEVFSNV